MSDTTVTGTATTDAGNDVPVTSGFTDQFSKHISWKKIIWVVWGVLTLLAIIGNIIDKQTYSSELLKDIVQDFFFISAFCIGANVAQKGIYAWKDAKTGDSQ